jgi:hypothetical protein
MDPLYRATYQARLDELMSAQKALNKVKALIADEMREAVPPSAGRT